MAMGISVTLKEALEKERENTGVFEPSGQGAPPEHLRPLYEEALKAYLLEGTLRGAARQTGLPVAEIAAIARTPWWRENVIEIRNSQRADNDRRMTRILDLTFDEIEEVLLNGEERAIPGLGVVRTKIPAASLAKLVEVMFDRRQLLRGEPTGISAEGHKLTELADRLEQLGIKQRTQALEPVEGGRETPQPSVDVEVKEVPHGGKLP